MNVTVETIVLNADGAQRKSVNVARIIPERPSLSLTGQT